MKIVFLTSACLLTVAISALCAASKAAPDTSSAAKNGSADSSADLVWFKQLEPALARAKADNKPVFLLFTGSTWCPPCVALKKEIFPTAQFKDYAKQHLILVKIDFPDPVDFPDDKLHLAEKYMGSEVKFPTMILLRPNGKEFGRPSLDDAADGPGHFVARLDKLVRK